MATRVEAILSAVRERLGDTRGERWSDSNLLSLLDEGQKDIAIHTNMFVGTYTLPLQDGKYMYDLPSDVLLIRRATFGDSPLAIVSYDRMDEYLNSAPTLRYDTQDSYNPTEYIDFPRQSWDNDTSNEIDALIFDNRNLLEIRVYPIPRDLADVVYPFDFVGPFSFEGEDLMGTVVDIEGYSFNNVFGFVTGLFDPNVEQEVLNSPYGVVTGIGESEQTVKLWYVRSPASVNALSSTLEVHPLFDTALKHYVVAQAFDDDVDTKSEAKSARAYSKYERELKVAFRTASRSGVQTSTRSTTYRGPFNG